MIKARMKMVHGHHLKSELYIQTLTLYLEKPAHALIST